MENLLKYYKSIRKKLPQPIITKLDNIDKERGGDGMYTVRNSPCGRVLIEEVTFKEKYISDWDLLDKQYKEGYRIILKPEVYFSDTFYKDKQDKIIVIYRSHKEIEKYPYNESDLIKKNKEILSGFVVVDVRDLNSKNGNKIYLGAKAIGRPDMEYATKEEIKKIQLCNLYLITKINNIDQFLDSKIIQEIQDFQKEFVLSELYTENENLRKFTDNGTVCPDTSIPLKFEDLIDGIQKSDVGRDKWLLTTTKINLHHIKKRRPGENNHNHKNVFLGTALGNTLDICLPPSENSSLEIMIKRAIWHYGFEKVEKMLNDIKNL